MVPPAGAGGGPGLSLSQSLWLPTALSVLGSQIHHCRLSLSCHMVSPCESGSVYYLSSVSSLFIFLNIDLFWLCWALVAA